MGGIIRIPGRIHITWQDDNAMKMEFDADRQTRIIRFLDPITAAQAPVLNEETPPSRGGGGRGPEINRPAGLNAPAKGSLKVVTTRMRAGYFRKNGLPYSEYVKDHRVLRPPRRLRAAVVHGADRARGSEVPHLAVCRTQWGSAVGVSALRPFRPSRLTAKSLGVN